MPPSGFSKKAVDDGILVFIKACYEDLLAEVRSGKHKSFEEAIEFEIAQIGKSLSGIHITPQGKLVKRRRS